MANWRDYFLQGMQQGSRLGPSIMASLDAEERRKQEADLAEKEFDLKNKEIDLREEGLKLKEREIDVREKTSPLAVFQERKKAAEQAGLSMEEFFLGRETPKAG